MVFIQHILPPKIAISQLWSFCDSLWSVGVETNLCGWSLLLVYNCIVVGDSVIQFNRSIFCSCPKQRPGFLTPHVVVYIHWFEVRGWCSFSGYLWICWTSLSNFSFQNCESGHEYNWNIFRYTTGLYFHEGRYFHFDICTCILFSFFLEGN